jgi:hypothetical protein
MSARPWDRRYALLIGLTATAGALDALAFLHLVEGFQLVPVGQRPVPRARRRRR